MRGEKLLIFLGAILLISSIASATESKIYDAWHFSGDTFTVDGEIIYVSHFNINDQKIVISANQKSSSIDLDTCWTTDTKRYCFVEMYNDVSGATSSSHIKFQGRDVYAGLHITIYKFAKEATVTRTFTPSIPTTESPIKVEVKIDNPTIYPTEGLIYTDVYPEGVVVVGGSSDVTTTLHGATFNKNVPGQSSRTFSYNIRINDYLTFSNMASYSYKIADTTVSKNTSAYNVNLESLKPYTSSITLSPASLETGAEALLTVSITNKNTNERLQINSIEFTAPPTNVSVTSESGHFKGESAGKYSWSGSVDKSATKDIRAKLRTTSSGTYKIPLSISIRSPDGGNYIEKKELVFTASYKEPTITLSIKDPAVSSGSPFKVSVSVKNPNSLTSYKDVHATLRSNISPQLDGYSDFILAGDAKTIITSKDIFAPHVETETNFPFTVTGQYSTAKGGGTFKATGNVKVSPINTSLSISHTVNAPNPLIRGSNVTVIVKAKYSNQDNVNIELKDSFSYGVKLTGGKTFETVAFTASGEKQAYIYSLFIPLDFPDPEITLETQATVLGKATTIRKITYLEIKDPITPKPEENAQGSEEIGQQEAENTEEEQKEEGTMAKIVNSTFSFIKRMLGFG